MGTTNIEALREQMRLLDTELGSLEEKLERIDKTVDGLSKRQYVALLSRSLSLMRMMGLPPQASAAAAMVQRLAIGFYHLYINIRMIYTLPGVGWLLGLTGVIFSAATMADAISIGEDIY